MRQYANLDDGNLLLLSVGSRFNIVMNYTTVNGTGTGETSILIRTVDGIPVFGSFLTEPQPPDTYVVKWDAEARPDPDCDPTESFCEMWLPGNYTVYVGMHCLLPSVCRKCAVITAVLFCFFIIVEVCNGQCGSQHPHSKIYDKATATFNVTKQ